VKTRRMHPLGLQGVIESLTAIIRRLRWRRKPSEWSQYYDQTNYTFEAMDLKEHIVRHYLTQCHPKHVWDLGANTGRFSRIAAQTGCRVVAMDADVAAVEDHYQKQIDESLNILPLVMDLTNPSPGIGWKNCERMSLTQRGPGDAVLALASSTILSF
jgi:hypothetical protein